MKLVQQYVETFTRKIEAVKSRDWQSEEQKYYEVCSAYATIMTLFTNYSDWHKLEDLKPIAKIFEEFQNEYFDKVL